MQQWQCSCRPTGVVATVVRTDHHTYIGRALTVVARTPFTPSCKTLITTNYDKTCKMKVISYNLQVASYNTCNLQPITAYSPIDGISLLTERNPDDSHHGRGAAHFLATFKSYCSCMLHVVTCSLQVLSFNFYRSCELGLINVS